MTVTYTSKVASSALTFGSFLKLLCKWRGSIYKLVWRDFLIFLVLYVSLTFLYRFLLTPHQQVIFEKVSYYCDKHGQLIPISFVLGFYVSLVVGRWWEQFKNIPWIDTVAIWIKANLRGNKEKDRLLRRTLMRYVNLAIVQCFILISPRIKKRFPTLEHLVEGGLLLENEKDIMQEIASSVPKFPTSTTFIPLVWAGEIITRARAQNKIKNDSVANIMLTEINKVKDQLNMLMCYDWISVPLVYTQVVTLAVYTYFLSTLMGRQWLFNREGALEKKVVLATEEPPKEGGSAEFEQWNELDFFLPLFTILQFFFYMGWLKTAESLLNPFGDDDDDFELNWFVDRNLQVGYLIVDAMPKDFPELLKDQWWDEIVPPDLPHTVASDKYKEEPPVGSTSGVHVTEKDTAVVLPSVSTVLDLTGAPKSSENLRMVHSSVSLKRKQAAMKDEGSNTENIPLLALDERVENVDTIHWDYLQDETSVNAGRPSIQDVFGIEFKAKPMAEAEPDLDPLPEEPPVEWIDGEPEIPHEEGAVVPRKDVEKAQTEEIENASVFKPPDSPDTIKKSQSDGDADKSSEQ